MFIQQADLFREVDQEAMNEISRIMVEQSFDRGAAFGLKTVFESRKTT